MFNKNYIAYGNGLEERINLLCLFSLEQGIFFQHLVWNRVTKLEFLSLVEGKGLCYGPAAHPHVFW